VDRNEVVFQLGSDDVTGIRFGISPGHELCNAVAVLQQPNAYPLQWGWLRSVQQRIPADALAVLTTVIAPIGYFPDFLTTSPTWQMSPADELVALRAAALPGVLVDLEKVHDRATGARRDAVARMLADPADALARIADAWEQVWQRLLAPHWDALHRLLSADIAYRARLIATDGLAVMINALHDRVSWQAGEVRVQLRIWNEVVPCEGQGLLLVPSVFSRAGCSVLTEKPVQPTLFYPVHGLTEMWHARDRDTRRALAALLGDGRARVLDCLDSPRSTSDTAAVCTLAVSTASHHLTLLRNAGLVNTTRQGQTAMHSRTVLGDALVSSSSA
jgi:DNA-binding transcriptional ArsR family regulator